MSVVNYVVLEYFVFEEKVMEVSAADESTYI